MVPLNSVSQRKRIDLLGCGSAPVSISLARARAISIIPADPLALSLAEGFGWSRWPTISISSLGNSEPRIRQETVSISPAWNSVLAFMRSTTRLPSSRRFRSIKPSRLDMLKHGRTASRRLYRGQMAV